MPLNAIITELMKNGILATINEKIDFETASIIAQDLGFEVSEEAVDLGEKMTLEKLASDTDKKFDGLAIMIKHGFDGVDKRFDIVENRLDVIENRLDVIEKRLDVIEKRLEVLEQEIEAIKLRFTEVAWRFEFKELEQRVRRLEGKVSSKR